MNFMGYMRPNGSAGARNYVAVLPTINCLNDAAYQLAGEIDGVLPLCHSLVCSYYQRDKEKALRALSGLAKNPNIYAVLIIGIGCEPYSADEFADLIAPSGKKLLALSIHKGGYDAMLEKGKAFLEKSVGEARRLKREPCDVGHIIFGTKCGGSGSLSLLSNNPAVGRAVDILIANGGSAIFSETPELLGAEASLVKRAVNEQVAEKLLRCVANLKEDIERFGVDLIGSEPNKGNIMSGLTTIEEKSLGAISKSGTSKLMDVLDFAQPLPGKGLYFMDCESAGDPVFVGEAAAGSQLGVMSLAGGMPATIRALASSGSALQMYPTLKVLGSNACPSEERYFDVCVGGIISNLESIDAAGERIFDKLISAASGEKTFTETHNKYFATIPLNRSGLIV
jgi:altronate dehydratase large subunit